MDKILKKLFLSKLGLILLVCVLALITFNYFRFLSEEWTLIINAISTSIIASFLVGAYFQFNIKDEISKDHIEIIRIKDELNKSGILKYYGSFKDCIMDLKEDVLKSKKITIYLNFGNTILNLLSDELVESYKKEKDIRIFILNNDNKFIEGLGALWGSNNHDYDKEGIIKKIDSSLNSLKAAIKEVKSKNELKANIEIYQLRLNPVFYSFYILDDKIYYTPSKIVASKNFPPLTILAQKTSNKGSIYNKCSYELNDILASSSYQKITDKEI